MTAVASPFRSYVEKSLDTFDAAPDRTVLTYGPQQLTAGELAALVRRIARALAARGVRRGQTVTLLSGNQPETLAARYAANLLGCRVNHLYNGLSAEAQAAIVRDVETAALIVAPALAARAAEVTAQASVDSVFALGPTSPTDSTDSPRSTAAGDLLALAAEESAAPFPSQARPDDICTIRHTGGTTGHPKGICTTFGQMDGARGVFAESPEKRDAPPARLLVCTTLAHAAGMVADSLLREGGSVVLHDGFDPAAVLAAIERERITHLFLLPPLLYQLLDHPDAARTDLSSLRCLTYGGCAASPARLADAVRRLGPVLMQFYGQNEAGGISVLAPEDHDPDHRPELLRTAGKVLPWVEVTVRDPETGRELPAGETGEICVRSDSVMQGYWKQPALTAEVLRDGWLHTGDLGHLDDAGYLTIADRLKDLIVVVGGHVYTSELEDLLNSHPQVRQSAVFGVPDADRMERVHAAVVPTPDASPTPEALTALVRARRGPMYEPAHVVFLDALPLTDAGKPDKKRLRALASAATAGQR